MGVGVWKLHHPCFLVFLEYYRVCDGFQLHNGSFCPFWSGDIFFAPCGDFCVFLHGDMHRSNMHALANSVGKGKMVDRTIDIECKVTTMSKIPLAVQTAGRRNRKGNVIGSVRMIAAALVETPKPMLRGCIHDIIETSQIDSVEARGTGLMPLESSMTKPSKTRWKLNQRNKKDFQSMRNEIESNEGKN
jgi:hypothetical protein